VSKLSTMKLIIGWLYPKQMSTYGDRGNILTIWQRCRWRGIEVEIKRIDIGEKINPTGIDFYFFGGGQDQAQKVVSRDLLENKKVTLKKAVRLGAVFLGICGGYQLFGHYYKPEDGKDIFGLGILDVTTVASDKRMIGNIMVETNKKIATECGKFLVGFENHSGKTFLGKKAQPLGNVVVGFGNNSEDRTEGAFQENVFGCYLHGPVLPKNPLFTDFLIKKALKRRYGEVKLSKLDDDLETKTQSLAIERSRETH